MDEAATLDELWPMVAAEAARLLGASARVMQWTGQHWVARQDSDSDEAMARESASSARAQGMPSAATTPRVGVAAGHARSVLVMNLDCSVLRVPTRLVWTSPEADAFVATADLAAEYTRLAGGAVAKVCLRTHVRGAFTPGNASA